MNYMIYADNAATTKLDIAAFEAMKPYLLDEYGNASQPYSFSRAPKKALECARETIAACINCDPDEIYFTSGGTESDNWAIKGVVFAASTRNKIITSAFEHHAILNVCKSMESMGHHITYLAPTTNGVITPQSLKEAITEQAALVSIMMSNNEIGTIQPIRELARIAHQHGALFHTDAVQSVGHIPIDVKELDVDLLSASAHKFNGPKGVGFLYIKKGTPITPLLNGGAQERNHRAGTEHIANIVAMSIALKNNCSTLNENIEHITELEHHFISLLQNSGVHYVRNGCAPSIPGNISLSFPGFDGEALMHRLDLMGILVSTGAACDSKNTQISHVLQSIMADTEAAKGTIRISFGKYNTKEEASQIVRAINKIIG